MSNPSETDPFVKWLVEVLHFPFDMTFHTPPPVDPEELALYWKEWDDWTDVANEDAISLIEIEGGWADD